MTSGTIPRARLPPPNVRTFHRLFCIALLAGAALPAWSQVSRDEAAAQAQQQTGGRVLSVDLADAGGRAVWRVKVVTPRGDVRVVMVDAGASRRP
jgi:hypothetical protein